MIAVWFPVCIAGSSGSDFDVGCQLLQRPLEALPWIDASPRSCFMNCNGFFKYLLWVRHCDWHGNIKQHTRHMQPLPRRVGLTGEAGIKQVTKAVPFIWGYIPGPPGDA